MTSVPRLHDGVCGTTLKTMTLIMLGSILAINIFGLVWETSMEMEASTDPKNAGGGQFDIRYVGNMVTAILLFLITPLGVYGVYRERANFILPFLGMLFLGTVLLAFNVLIEFVEWADASAAGSFATVFSLTVVTALFAFSMLILYSFYLQVKEQREELK